MTTDPARLPDAEKPRFRVRAIGVIRPSEKPEPQGTLAGHHGDDAAARGASGDIGAGRRPIDGGGHVNEPASSVQTRGREGAHSRGDDLSARTSPALIRVGDHHPDIPAFLRRADGSHVARLLALSPHMPGSPAA